MQNKRQEVFIKKKLGNINFQKDISSNDANKINIKKLIKQKQNERYQQEKNFKDYQKNHVQKVLPDQHSDTNNFNQLKDKHKPKQNTNENMDSILQSLKDMGILNK